MIGQASRQASKQADQNTLGEEYGCDSDIKILFQGAHLRSTLAIIHLYLRFLSRINSDSLDKKQYKHK
jgi:hypothetical protein